MNVVLPDAIVAGYEGLLPEMAALGDDAHVLAAAVHGGAAIIVTSNLKGFPAETLRCHGVVAQSPDEFLCRLFRLAPDDVCLTLLEQAAGTSRPSLTTDQVLDRLGRMVPGFVAQVRQSPLLAAHDEE